MTRRLDRDALLGLITLLVIAAVLTLGLSGVLRGLLGTEDARRVQAVFRDTQQLRDGDEVRIQGVQAGKVTDIDLEPGGRVATVTMDVDDDAGPLYRDARAVLRWRNVLGAGFYVDLERGAAAGGPLRGAIPLARTDRQTEVEDIVATVQGRARRGLQTLPRELADALEDEQAPARLLRTVSDVAPGVRDGLHAARGVALDRDLRGLVSDTSRTLAALNAPDGDLRAVVSGAAATLRTTAARDRELRGTLARAGLTQAEMQRTLRRLRGTLALADSLLDDLREPADDVAPTLAALRPGVVDADRLARRAVPLLRALRPAARALAGTAQRGLPLVRDLEPSLERLDKTILPYLAEKDPGTGKSTAVMIGGTFTGLASGAAGQMDDNGHFIRFPATVGSSPMNSLPCQIYLLNPDAAQIAACTSLQEALETYMEYQPLSETPGTEPDPGKGGG